MAEITAKKYIERLQELVKDFGEQQLVHAADDEGNAFTQLVYMPSVGHFDGFDFEPLSEDNIKTLKINAICVN